MLCIYAYHQTPFREVPTRHFDGSKMFLGQIFILLEFFEIRLFFQNKKSSTFFKK